jgi:hypothetical protein
MGTPRSLTAAWIALGAATLFAFGSGAYYLSRRRPPPGLPPQPVPAPRAPSPIPALQPATAEGRATVELAALLSSLRRPDLAKAEAESVEREAQARSARLVDDLGRRPESWPEVVELATGAEDLKVALRLAATLGASGGGEALWVERLSPSGPVRRRQVAATALAGGTTASSLNALVGASDGDRDAGVRLAAVASLAQRRLGATPESAGAIEQALRRRSESDPEAHVREVARNLLTPTPPPGLRPPPRKK